MAADSPQLPTSVLTLSSFQQGDATVVQCRGKVISGTSGDLHAEVKALLASSKHVILDLTDVTQMDSSGLGAIAGLYISAKATGCRLELINLSKRVRELLSLTNILLLFESAGEHNIRVG